MFDFFEEIVKGIGIKLISDFDDKLIDFIKSINNKKTSGNKISDNENYTQIESNGDYTKIASSGDDTKIASSGYYTQIGSIGDDTQIGSIGEGTRIGSSGNVAQIGSSGYYTQIGSSGDDTQIGSSGYGTQIGSSGDGTRIGSSGKHTHIGSCGYGTHIGSSGYYTQIGSSGDYTKIRSSGDYTQIASSGYGTQTKIEGENSVAFSCGEGSITSGKKGTWIALCEYKNNMPFFAKVAQIGNKDYTDFKGRELQENEYYCLYNKEFYPVDISDDILTIKLNERKKGNLVIIKGLTISWKRSVYIVKENEVYSHGNTLKEAMEDLQYKKLKSKETKEIIEEIKRTGKVNRQQYRAITGACQFGTEQFCKEHNIENLEEIELEELRKILINDYGAKEFWNLIDDVED